MVSFPLSYDDLGFWTNDPGGRFVVEAGDFTLTVSDGIQHHECLLRLT
jgi:predicted naringenin-chalcone synthase